MFSLLKVTLLALALSTAQAAPMHNKRIAQVISASTTKWENACLAAGGDEQCNPISIAAFTTLLAAAGPCDQQNAAEQMLALAKTLKNNGDLIKLTQIFAQQPRNTPSSESVQYCQVEPKNPELKGLFQCQFAGAKTQTFVGGVPVGSPGTIPLGHSSPLSPAGSCPANPNGPIPDGTQLADITQNPGSGNLAEAPGPAPAPSLSLSSSADPGPAPTPVLAQDQGKNKPAGGDDTCDPPSKPTSTPTPPSTPPAAGGSFSLQNGKDAQKLNAQFSKLTANSSCTAGQNACVNGGFAQCVGGKFAVTQCGASLTCAALPLVNSPGTSITCTTPADALTRIANTGAQGGLTGSG